MCPSRRTNVYACRRIRQNAQKNFSPVHPTALSILGTPDGTFAGYPTHLPESVVLHKQLHAPLLAVLDFRPVLLRHGGTVPDIPDVKDSYTKHLGDALAFCSA